jgi:hypothetical protein
MNYTEETEKVKHDSVLVGIPKLRYVEADRKSPGGVEEADRVLPLLLDELTRPLNAAEKKSSTWAPEQPRILFEGTLPEAEAFYQQTEKIPNILNAEWSMYTDGLPVVIPTEERVEEMLTGTSHKPDELITLQHDFETRAMEGTFQPAMKRNKGEVIKFMPMGRTATVEQIAVNAVMAGCRPEYFPAVLAMAESGGCTGDGRSWGGGFVFSGPIVKELGMNVSYLRFGPCNPANKTIGRAGSLIWRNIGGWKESVTGVGVGLTYGNPVTNGGFIMAEYQDGLPKGWKGFNEEKGFKKNESILMPFSPGAWGVGQEHLPGVYRSLQRTGHGAIARFLNVKGIPGPHNYLEFLMKDIWACREGGFTFVIPPQIAQDLADFGFKTKESIYEWMWKRSFVTVANYKQRGMGDLTTNGWLGIERTSGKHWRELSDDYLVPAGGSGPEAYCLIVAHGQETAVDRFGGSPMGTHAFSIDAWR